MKENRVLLNNMNYNELNPLITGWEICDPGQSFGPYIREYYLLHYVISGNGVLYNDSGVHHIKENQIFVIKPDEVTTYSADKKNPWHYIWIGFNGKIASKLDSLPCVIDYTENTFFEIKSCEKLSSNKELYLTGKLFELFSKLSVVNTEKPSYEKNALDYISTNYMHKIKIEEVAEHIGVNREHLSRLFKSAYGMSMREFLLSTRLKHAADFLKSGFNVSNAAALCGYDDIFNFSKMFKSKYGISPSMYRKNFK